MAISVLVAMAVTVAGCGGSGHSSASGTTANTPSPSRTVVPVLVLRAQGTVSAFVEVTIKGHPVALKVDTGATNTTLDSTVATALALPPSGPAATSTSIGCTTAVQPVAISDWKLGDAALPAGRVASEKTQFAGLKTNTGVPIGGLLGEDVLSRFGTVTLDFAGKRLILGGKPPADGQTFPVQVAHVGRGTLVETHVTIGHSTVVLAVDTGAGTTQIDSRTTSELGLQAAGPAKTISAVNCPATVTPVRVAAWHAGGVKLPPTVAGSSLQPLTDKTKGTVVGLLGADVLSTFGEVTVEFAGNRVGLGGGR